MTTLGMVRGNAIPGADEFLGIPYGDANRFEAATTRTAKYPGMFLKALVRPWSSL